MLIIFLIANGAGIWKEQVGVITKCMARENVNLSNDGSQNAVLPTAVRLMSVCITDSSATMSLTLQVSEGETCFGWLFGSV